MPSVLPYSTTHAVYQVDGVPHGYEYGHLWPLRSYTLRWTCGHTADVTIASLTPCELAYDMPGACPDCYHGPYFNVWD